MFPDKEVLLTSLGMTIIDDNHYPPSWNKPDEFNILGGAGPYAIIGGRIIAGKDKGGLVSGIIDEGYDFPHDLERLISSWKTGIMVRFEGDRMTTRGKNIYQEDHVRDFEYMNEKRQIEACDIHKFGLGRSKTFHLICSMTRAESIIEQLNKYAEEKGAEKPKYIYEPVPFVCTYDNLDELIETLPKIDVFSPNLSEAADLANKPLPKTEEKIRKLAEIYYPHLHAEAALVFRCGEMGCYVKTSTVDAFYPAYHSDQGSVKDVTGAGNGFCGAFMTGYMLTGGNWVASAICGNLASGCIIEQLGIPTKTEVEGKKEMWNGLAFEERLDNYLSSNSELFKDLDKSIFNWN